jgi:disulfide bond formation protein DsbB
MFILVFLSLIILLINESVRIIDDCQLVIVGGTTAALGAILSASKLLNNRVYLPEPTD